MSAVKAEEEILALVQTAVERFILNKVNVGDFLDAMRAVAKKEEVYFHPLTKQVFSRIVKEAARKRKHSRPG